MMKVFKILLGMGMAALLVGCSSGDKNNKKTLTIKAPFPGITVSLHDPDEHFKRLKTKTTGSDGSASFDVDGDTVTVSVSYSGQIEITPEFVFKRKKQELIYSAQLNCKRGDINISECHSANWCAMIDDNATLPAWVVNEVFLENSDLNISAIDPNKDGKVSVDEFYEVAKTIYDKDKNDAITLQELVGGENVYVSSKLFVNIPVMAYGFAIKNKRAARPRFYAECSKGNQFTLGLTHADGIRDLIIEGSNGRKSWQDDNGSSMSMSAVSMNVDIGHPDTKGKYDYLVVMKRNNIAAKHIEALLDRTEGDLQDGISYDVSTLEEPSMKEVTVLGGNIWLKKVGGVPDPFLDISASYNGIPMNYREVVEWNATKKSVFKQYYNDKLTYSLSGGVGDHKADGNIYMMYRHDNGYYGDGKLKDTYKVSDYPMLDVDVSFEGDGVQFGGGDVEKIDVSSFESRSSFANKTKYRIEVVGTGAIKLDGRDLKPDNILPSSISTLMSGEQNITDRSAEAIEDKFQDGISIFKKGLNHSVYGPKRSVSARKYPYDVVL